MGRRGGGGGGAILPGAAEKGLPPDTMGGGDGPQSARCGWPHALHLFLIPFLRHIPQMSSYVKVKVGKQDAKTYVAYNSSSPTWSSDNKFTFYDVTPGVSRAHARPHAFRVHTTASRRATHRATARRTAVWRPTLAPGARSSTHCAALE